MLNLFLAKKSASYFRFYLLFGFVVLAITSAPRHVFALPETCRADGGKTWTFSIGRTVFELTNYNPSILASEADNVGPQDRLIPPNPAVPIGCKDNPQQLSYFRPKGGWPRLQPVGYAGDMPEWTTLWLDRFPPPDGDEPKADAILFLREQSAENCKNKKYLKRYDDGTILCTDQPSNENSKLFPSADQSVSEWEFIISAKRYSTPLGDNLVVDNGILGPSATYLLTPEILLNYSWWIIGRKTPVDPAFVIRVDQSIISALQAQEVKDYPWPMQTSLKSEQ